MRQRARSRSERAPAAAAAAGRDANSLRCAVSARSSILPCWTKVLAGPAACSSKLTSSGARRAASAVLRAVSCAWRVAAALAATCARRVISAARPSGPPQRAMAASPSAAWDKVGVAAGVVRRAALEEAEQEAYPPREAKRCRNSQSSDQTGRPPTCEVGAMLARSAALRHLFWRGSGARAQAGWAWAGGWRQGSARRVYTVLAGLSLARRAHHVEAPMMAWRGRRTGAVSDIRRGSKRGEWCGVCCLCACKDDVGLAKQSADEPPPVPRRRGVLLGILPTRANTAPVREHACAPATRRALITPR